MIEIVFFLLLEENGRAESRDQNPGHERGLCSGETQTADVSTD